MKLAKLMSEIDDCTGGINNARFEHAKRVFFALTDAQRKRVRAVECHDEHTGARFGRAAKRAGQCVKIGSGGRHKGSAYAYQIWLDWS